MKKIILGLIVFLLIGCTALAITLSNKEEALTYFRNYKDTRESNIEKAVATIIYTSDKECNIDYETEEIRCNVCFVFTAEGKDNDMCVGLKENSTQEEDDQRAINHVKEEIKYLYPMENVKYTKRAMKDRVIQVTASPKVEEKEMSLPSNEYYCSTDTERIETCVCLSVSKRTCYYETCGSSPYGICTGGEWIKVTI